MASDDPDSAPNTPGDPPDRDAWSSDGPTQRDASVTANRGRLVVARRELGSLKREKTIVLAILIQLFVAAFSSFLVFGLSSMYDPGSVEGATIDVAVSGEASDALIDAAATVDGVRANRYTSEAAARAAFADGLVQGVLHGEYRQAQGANGTVVQVTATAPEGSVRSTVIVVQLREVLEALERQERDARAEHLEQPPLELPEDVDASPYFGFTYTVLVPLLLFLPPFISGSVAVDSVTEEIERGTLTLLRVTPLRLVDVVDGKALAMIAIVPVQVLLWILLLTFNGIRVAHPIALVTYVTAVTTVVVALGVALGVSLRRRRPAQLVYSVLALALFGVAVLAPEHPATTAARLAVDSPGPLTYWHLAGAIGLAVVATVLARRYVSTFEREPL